MGRTIWRTRESSPLRPSPSAPRPGTVINISLMREGRLNQAGKYPRDGTPRVAAAVFHRQIMKNRPRISRRCAQRGLIPLRRASGTRPRFLTETSLARVINARRARSSGLFWWPGIVTRVYIRPFNRDSRLGSLNNIFGNLQRDTGAIYAAWPSDKSPFRFYRYLEPRDTNPPINRDNCNRDASVTITVITNVHRSIRRLSKSFSRYVKLPNIIVYINK